MPSELPSPCVAATPLVCLGAGVAAAAVNAKVKTGCVLSCGAGRKEFWSGAKWAVAGAGAGAALGAVYKAVGHGPQLAKHAAPVSRLKSIASMGVIPRKPVAKSYHPAYYMPQAEIGAVAGLYQKRNQKRRR